MAEVEQISKIKCHYQETAVIRKMASFLCENILINNPIRTRPVIVLAIGTDRSTGDSLGPLVGTKLKNTTSPGLFLYGTLEEPVHAVNLPEIIEEINKRHHDPFIIAIDACLGRSENIGYITLSMGSLKPGAGVHKELPAVGDISFTATVNIGGYMEYFMLQNTRLSVVMNLANCIASSIKLGYQMFLQKSKYPLSSDDLWNKFSCITNLTEPKL